MEDSIKEHLEDPRGIDFVKHYSNAKPYGLRISHLAKVPLTEPQRKILGLDDLVKEFSLFGRDQLVYLLAWEVGSAKHWKSMYELAKRDGALRDEFFERNKKPAIVIPFKKKLFNKRKLKPE
jgi:hypothetical protein